MICLAVDTAGPLCAAAVARDGGGDGAQVLSRREERIGRGHAERVMPVIGEALDAAGMTFADIDRIAVAAGPGSFTGVRVGVAAARGLALALDVPAFGIDVLAAIAAGARTAGGDACDVIIAALDARRDAIYLRAEDRDGAVLVRSAVVAGAAIRRMLSRIGDRSVGLAGPGAAIVADAVGAWPGKVAVLGETAHADIAMIAALGLSGAGATPPVPLYLRAPDAKPQAEHALVRA